MPHRVEDYWNWLPAVRTGTAERAQKDDTRQRDTTEARIRQFEERHAAQRDAELALRATQSRAQIKVAEETLAQRRTEQAFKEKQQLDELEVKEAYGFGFEGYTPAEGETLTPAFRAGLMQGRAAKEKQDEAFEMQLQRALQTWQIRKEIEDAKRENRPPSRFDYEEVTVEDRATGRKVKRYVPRGGASGVVTGADDAAAAANSGRTNAPAAQKPTYVWDEKRGQFVTPR